MASIQQTTVVVVVLLCALATVHAVVPADEITSLPGWSGALPSKQYSGYFAVGENKDRFMHYWFCESQGDPSTDPVVMWMNGGPGASSLMGFFTENGPFSLSNLSLNASDPTGVPTLLYNPNSWNLVSSMLFIESPAGVGFSYCENESDCWFNDQKTASDNYETVAAFFAAYPEFKEREFYITGESYAGIYIPTLVQQIEQHPDAGINLKGFAIGDGCIGDEVGSCSNLGIGILADFFAGQAFYSASLHDKVEQECVWAEPSTECQALVKQMNAEIGQYYVYNVYDTCGNDNMMALLDQYPEHPTKGGWVAREFNPAYYNTKRHDWEAVARDTQPTKAEASVYPMGGLNDYPCGGSTVMAQYLNFKSVQDAIHVKTDVPHFKFNYTSTVKNLLPDYPGFISKYRVLIYSGNVDACIPWVGTENWTTGLGMPVKEGWRPWNYESKHGTLVGGYVTLYDNDFAFLTVKGSGHMVPTYKPVPALTFIKNFLAGKPY